MGRTERKATQSGRGNAARGPAAALRDRLEVDAVQAAFEAKYPGYTVTVVPGGPGEGLYVFICSKRCSKPAPDLVAPRRGPLPPLQLRQAKPEVEQEAQPAVHPAPRAPIYRDHQGRIIVREHRG